MNQLTTFIHKNLLITKILTIRWFSSVFPSATAQVFATLWFKVIKPKPHRRRLSLIEQAVKFDVSHRGQYLPIYQLQHTAPKGQVLLVHGWSGRWDQLIEIAESLYTNGFNVVFFDLPSHGENSGVSADVFEFSEFISKVSKQMNLHSTVSICHSAGFLALAHAKFKYGFEISRLVTINSPADFDYLIDVFHKKIRFSKKLIPALWKLVDQRVGVKGARFQLETTHMSTISAEKVLIIHDLNDPEVDFKQTEKMKQIWPLAQIIKTDGLGHNRSLRDKKTIALINQFILNEIPQKNSEEKTDEFK